MENRNVHLYIYVPALHSYLYKILCPHSFSYLYSLSLVFNLQIDMCIVEKFTLVRFILYSEYVNFRLTRFIGCCHFFCVCFANSEMFLFFLVRSFVFVLF